MEFIKYEKFFVMLEEEGADFAFRKSASIKGHIKIETGNNKGAMRIGIQNLKPYDKSTYIYKLIFFGKVRERTIYAIVGTVMVSKVGTGETYFRFDPKNLDGKDHGLSLFSHAIVAAVSVKDEKEQLHPVLKGMLDFPFEEEIPIRAAALNERLEESETDIKMEESKEAIAYKCYNSYYNKYLCSALKKIDDEKNVYDQVVPFREDQVGAEWTKIGNPGTLPLVSPGAKILSEKYRHYIFGKNKENYYIGVPGRFLKSEQPEEGTSGFILWQPILGAEMLNATSDNSTEENRKLAYGYWIVAININTGDILEP